MNLVKIKNLSDMQKIVHIALVSLIFIIVLLVLSLPYQRIGFDSDAIGKVVTYLSKSYSPNIFFQGDNDTNESLNEQKQPAHFFSHYRPLEHILFYICTSLFKASSYYYFLLSILFHTCVSIIIFYAFSHLFNLFIAWLLTLFFAFFPSHYMCFLGLSSALNPVYFFLSLSLLFFIWYQKNRKIHWYIISVVCYLLSLFSYELPIFVPTILLLYFVLFQKNTLIKDTWMFFGAASLYVIVRFSFLKKFKFPALTSMIETMETIPLNAYRSVKPFLGLQEMPKIVAALIFSTIVLFSLFYIATNLLNRKKMLFYIAAFCISVIPACIYNGKGIWSGRYMYISVPFFLLIMVESFIFLYEKLSLKRHCVVTSTLLLMGISWGVARSWQNLHTIEEYTVKKNRAFELLAQQYGDRKNIKLIFLGTVSYFNGIGPLMESGITQAARFFFNNSSLLAYHVSEAQMWCREKPALFTILPITQGYRFIANNAHNSLWMPPQKNEAYAHSMGVIKVHTKVDDQPVDVSFVFDEKWLGDITNTIFVTWDPIHWQFVELKKDHLGVSK